MHSDFSLKNKGPRAITAGLSGCCAVRYRHPVGFLVYGETLSMGRKVCGWAEESSLRWKNMDGLEWSQVGIFRTKVDEKVDISGWRIKIVADGGLLLLFSSH